MKLKVQDTQVEIAPPADSSLEKKLWDRWDRVPDYVPEEVNKVQFVTAAVSAANAWWQSGNAVAKAKGVRLDLNSLAKSIFNAAVVGLPLVDALGYAYLVPMHVDQETRRERVECQLWMGYKGFIELGRQSGVIDVITPEIIWADEQFERWNDEKGAHFKHKPSLDRPAKIEMGDIKGAYVVSLTPKGQSDFEIVTGSELRQLAKRGNVWRTNPVPMSKKSPIRRIGKRWPQTNRLAAATRLDEQAESEEQQTAFVPEVQTIVDAETVQVAVSKPPAWIAQANEKWSECKTADELNATVLSQLDEVPESDREQLLELAKGYQEAAGLASNPEAAEETGEDAASGRGDEEILEDFRQEVIEVGTVRSLYLLVERFVNSHPNLDSQLRAISDKRLIEKMTEAFAAVTDKKTLEQRVTAWEDLAPHLATSIRMAASARELELKDSQEPVEKDAEESRIDRVRDKLQACSSAAEVDKIRQEALKGADPSEFDAIWDLCDSHAETIG